MHNNSNISFSRGYARPNFLWWELLSPHKLLLDNARVISVELALEFAIIKAQQIMGGTNDRTNRLWWCSASTIATEELVEKISKKDNK